MSGMHGPKTIKTPMVIGHEYMGYIEKMGAGVRISE